MTGGKLIKYKGTTKNISDYVVGLVTRNPIARLRANKVYVTEQPSYLATGFAGLITTENSKRTPIVNRRGEQSHLHKLTRKEILEIRDLLKYGMSGVQIARDYNVTKSNVYCIKNGKSWAWLK